MKKYFLIGLFFCSLAACQSEMDKYYEIPDWLKGNAYEVMKDKGTFSTFMKAVERSSYADLVKLRYPLIVSGKNSHYSHGYTARPVLRYPVEVS